MPSLEDFVEIAREIADKPVLPAEKRCVTVRNRNASCHRCQEVCPADAIEVRDNRLSVDFSACVGCQACATVCPTGALVAAAPADQKLAEALHESRAIADGVAIIACARIASKGEADPRMYVQVPCLSRVDESLLIGLVAQGVSAILLVDGGCDTCKHQVAGAVAAAVCASADALLAAWGSAVRIEQTGAFPAHCLLSARERNHVQGESRRRFFAGARDGAKKAASATIAQQFGSEVAQSLPTLHEMFGVNMESNTLPQFEPRRQLGVMNALDRIGEPCEPDVPLAMRLWGRVTIDEEACIACGLCTTFCPTGSLSAASEEDARFEGCDMLVEQWAASCTQCRLCEDVCIPEALTVTNDITPGQLMDFEPRAFRLTDRMPRRP